MPPFLEYGMRSALAYREPWTTDMNFALKNEAMDNAVKAAKDAKIAAVADKIKFATAENSYDKAQLKDYYKTTLIPSIGKYVAENPDWEHNVTKRMEFQSMLNEFTDNEIASRAARVDEGYKNFATYLKTNSVDLADPTSEASKLATQYDNYLKTGDIDGVAANKKEFVFVKPEKFDINITAEALAKTMKPKSETWGTDANSLYFGITDVYDKDIKASGITAMYNDGNNKEKITQLFNELTPEQQTSYVSPYGYWEAVVESKLDEGVKSIQSKYSKSGSGSGSGGGSGSDDARWSDYKVLLKNGTAKGVSANIYLANVTGTGSSAGATLNKSNTGLSPMYIMGKGGNIVPSNISNEEDIIVKAGSSGEITYYTNPNTGKKLAQFVTATVDISDADYNKLKPWMQAGFTSYKNKSNKIYHVGTAYLPVEQTRIDGSGAEWTRAYGGYKTEGLVNINESGTPTTPAATGTQSFTGVPAGGF